MNPGFRSHRRALLLPLLAAWLCLVPAAWAQMSQVTLEVDSEFVGLGGVVRPGAWTPLRMSMRNHGAEPRPVICRWVTHDFDGDAVPVERRATLTPNRTQHVWLYAAPAVNRPAREGWTVQVLEDDNGRAGRLLAHQQVGPRTRLEPGQSLIAAMSSASLGLEPYTERYTQHEAVSLLRGITLYDLPDRWFGLSALRTIIWTREGGDPDDPRVTLEHQQALREWVRRGGHLVVLMPAFGQAWTSSPLADLLPVEAGQLRRVERRLPGWVGSPSTENLSEIEYLVFDLPADAGVEVLHRDRQGDAAVVAKRFGFGRVTVVGVNLADRRLVQMGVPNGRFRLWNDVFHWQSPVYEKDVAEVEVRQGHMARPDSRERIELGRFVPAVIAMRNTAGPVLLLAILVFGIYWLLAGPIGFVVLRQKGWLRHSWVAFVGVVGLFTLIAWGGAMFAQPRQASVAHFSVVDFDARTGTARTQSWLSLFVPEFGHAGVSLGEPGEGQHTLASPGWLTGPEAASFLDPQSWRGRDDTGAGFPAASPAHASVPMRATAKQFEIDYLGPIGEGTPGMRESWSMPQAERLRVENHWPAGRLAHGLPGTLRDVLIVYCPGASGDGDQRDWMPWVWRHGDWAPGDVIELGRPTNLDRLVRRPRAFEKDREWRNEGFLGQLVGRRTGQAFIDRDPLAVAAPANEIMQAAEMLSFYAALPAPNFRASFADLRRPAASYQRELGRNLDITPLITGRRLIVIGHLENTSLPAPLTLDGQPVEPSGSSWTVVRWIYDF